MKSKLFRANDNNCQRERTEHQRELATADGGQLAVHVHTEDSHTGRAAVGDIAGHDVAVSRLPHPSHWAPFTTNEEGLDFSVAAWPPRPF